MEGAFAGKGKTLPGINTQLMKRIISSDFFYLFLILMVWAGCAAISENDPTGFSISLRLVLGIVIVLFFPGYAIQAAIFPRRQDQDAWTRLVFSFGFSIVIIPIMALILNAAVLGINFPNMVGGVVGVFFAGTIVAAIIRRRLPEEERRTVVIKIPPVTAWFPGNRTDRILQGILLAAIGVAGISAVYVYRHPSVESYTEFFFIDRTSSAEGDPRLVIAGDPWKIGLGIVNHEGQASQYKIIVMTEDGRGLGELGPLLLQDGMSWEGEMILTVQGIGENQKINFLLERIGYSWPYRTLRLWINVMEKEMVDPTGTYPPGG
jgi:uncharacterized membrane protein